MKLFEHPVGSIIQLIGHDSAHCGVVVDAYRSVELIAFKNEAQQKMISKLVLIDLASTPSHPLTGKSPNYKLRELPSYPWATNQLKSRIKALKPKYEGTEYHIIHNNCQHFAWELSTGQAKSPDADAFKPLGGLIGFAFKMKDFGMEGSTSSVNASDIQVLQQSLNQYLMV